MVNGFQQLRVCLLKCVAERHLSCCLKSHVVTINRMHLSIKHAYAQIPYKGACKRSAMHLFHYALQNGKEESLVNCSANYAVIIHQDDRCSQASILQLQGAYLLCSESESAPAPATLLRKESDLPHANDVGLRQVFLPLLFYCSLSQYSSAVRGKR